EAERARAVARLAHEAEAVALEEVAALEVEDEAADDPPRIELQITARPAARSQPVAHLVVGAPLPRRDLVVHERVVHVVADGADRAHVQRAIAEDAAPGRGDHVRRLLAPRLDPRASTLRQSQLARTGGGARRRSARRT